MAESYPSFRAGQKVSASLLDSMKPITVRKVLDTPRATATVTDDPELTFQVQANAVYRMEGILYVSNTTATDDITIDWTTPASSTGSWGAIGPATDTAVETDSTVRTVGTSSIDASRAYGTSIGGASSPLTIHVRSLLITTSAGTYALAWARNTGTGTTTVYNDSFLSLQRIA